MFLCLQRSFTFRSGVFLFWHPNDSDVDDSVGIYDDDGEDDEDDVDGGFGDGDDDEDDDGAGILDHQPTICEPLPCPRRIFSD